MALASASPYHLEEDSPAKYDFSYSVHDTQTGDIKQQHEVRDGDNVRGQYSLVDADGLHRIVDYTADDVNGFQATVRREPITTPLEPIHKVAVVAAPVAKYVAAAPVAHYAHSAPVATVYTHAAPVTKYVAAAPVAHYAHAAPVTKVVSSPVHHHYAAASPVVYHSAPVVSSPVTHYSAAAPVAHYSHSPVAHYTSSPVAAHYVAPVARYAPVSGHVSYQTPAHTYHY